MLEGELPPNPSGGTAIPVTYTIVVEDAAHVPQTVAGRFDETLSTQRLGRRGTATVVQAHHAARQVRGERRARRPDDHERRARARRRLRP